MSTDLPEAVYELLESRVNTFEKLELIVALHESPRATASIEALCHTLKLPRDLVRQAAMELRASSLLELTSRGEAQLLPLSQRDQTTVSELVRIYHEDGMSLVKALGEIGMRRLRSMAAHAFADAFVLRRKPPKDGEDG